MEINLVAVLVASLAAYVVGWLWHGPVFGKKWMALEGFTPESMAAMNMKAGAAMALGFVTTYLTAAVLSWLIAMLAVSGVVSVLGVSFAVWLGFTMTTLAGKWLWEGKSFALFSFNALHSLVSLLVMGYVLSLFS